MTDTSGDIEVGAEEPTTESSANSPTAVTATPDSSGGADGGAGGGVAPLSQAELMEAAPIAVEIGWTMAVLFGHFVCSAEHQIAQLPTEHELPPDQRKALEVGRLKCLLGQIAAVLPSRSAQQFGSIALPDDPMHDDLLEANLEILEALACPTRELELAYQLGRSLRDTSNPPLVAADGDMQQRLEGALNHQLSRQRIAKIQEWMSTLSPILPPDSAVIVSASVGRWSDFAITILDRRSPGSLRRLSRNNTKVTIVPRILGSLLGQGDAWINVLTGAEATAGLLTPEAYVAAGEAALNRTARIVRRVVLHYWFAFLILAAALAAIITFAAIDLSGAGKVWTQIAAIASSIGISAKGIASGVVRLSGKAEKPIYESEKVDAMAWAVTILPQVKLNHRGVRALRRSGIQRSRALGPV